MNEQHSPQMSKLLRRYGVKTERQLLTAIAREESEETGLSYRTARSIAPVLLDRMLDAEFNRMVGGCD